MILALGQIVAGRYRILAGLGQGGMGAVYRARAMESGDEVALKVMFPQPDLRPEQLSELRAQFEQEANTLARLEHPHLVRVTDAFEEDGSAFLVMTYVAGESLATYIIRFGALAESQVILWAHQLLDVLAYCHSQGVIHRDIKPQNVIIRPDGDAVLADFGLAKLWDPGDRQTRTMLRGMGTPEYAPPEQWGVQTANTDPRSDLYSLGATLYHALTGQVPPTVAERREHPDTFRPPRALRPAISPRMEDLLLRALELPVERRFATAQEMLAALMATSDDLDTPTRPIKLLSQDSF